MKFRGVLKMYDSSRGFGFIKPDDGGSDVFVHVRSIRDSGITIEPAEGMRLDYQTEQGDRGPRAVKLSLVS